MKGTGRIRRRLPPRFAGHRREILFINGATSMDGFLGPERVSWRECGSAEIGTKPRRWVAHTAHTAAAAPHRLGRPMERAS